MRQHIFFQKMLEKGKEIPKSYGWKRQATNDIKPRVYIYFIYIFMSMCVRDIVQNRSFMALV